MKAKPALAGIQYVTFFCFVFNCPPAFSQFELIKDINQYDNQGSYPTKFIELNGVLCFLANDGDLGLELWKTNGTTSGTQLVSDINPGKASGMGAVAQMAVHNGKLYFTADDGEHGPELWSSNLTSTGMVEDLRLVDHNHHIYALTVVNNKLLFLASPAINDQEWWRVNDDNTVEIVKDIDPEGGGARAGSIGMDLIFFQGHHGGPQGSGLWITDGTATGTKSVEADMRVGAGHGVEYNGKMYLMADKPGYDGFELYKAVQSGASMVKNINPEAFGSSQPKADDFHGLVYKGILYFNAFEPTHGDALWRTDGTEAGTIMVKDIYPGAGANTEKGHIGAMRVFNDFLYFTAVDNTTGSDLWKTDGTAAGTEKVKDFGGGITNRIYELHGKMYFMANDGSHGVELWVSDGTEGGTRMVEDFNPGISHGVGEIAVYKDKIFLYGIGPSGAELYSYTPIDCEAPEITSHPIGDTIHDGESVTLSVSASGDGLSYQWQKDNIDLQGENSALLIIEKASSKEEGDYICLVINDCTAIKSDVASIVVEQKLVLGTKGTDEKRELDIFPNPANKWLNISHDTSLKTRQKIFIFNMQGTLVMEKFFEPDDKLINVENMKPGPYLIRMFSTKYGLKSSKLIIQR